MDDFRVYVRSDNSVVVSFTWTDELANQYGVPRVFRADYEPGPDGPPLLGWHINGCFFEPDPSTAKLAVDLSGSRIGTACYVYPVVAGPTVTVQANTASGAGAFYNGNAPIVDGGVDSRWQRSGGISTDTLTTAVPLYGKFDTWIDMPTPYLQHKDYAWTTVGEGEGVLPATKGWLTSNATIQARWSDHHYKVYLRQGANGRDYVVRGYSGITGNVGDYVNGGTVPLPSADNTFCEGYVLTGWKYNTTDDLATAQDYADLSNPDSRTSIPAGTGQPFSSAQDYYLFPVFQEKTYTVIYDPKGGEVDYDAEADVEGVAAGTVLRRAAGNDDKADDGTNKPYVDGDGYVYYSRYRYSDLAATNPQADGDTGETAMVNTGAPLGSADGTRLGAKNNKGFDMQGWTWNSAVEAGSDPADYNAKTYKRLTTAGDKTSWAGADNDPTDPWAVAQAKKECRLYFFPNDDTSERNNANPIATAYAVWTSTGDITKVTLGVEAPLNNPNDDFTDAASPRPRPITRAGAADGTLATTDIFWWPGHGITDGNERLSENPDETTVYNYSVPSDGSADVAGADMGSTALGTRELARHGFSFMGWGLATKDHASKYARYGATAYEGDVVEGHPATTVEVGTRELTDCAGDATSGEFVLYLSYNAGAEGGAGAFRLTESGASLLKGWDDHVTLANIDDTTVTTDDPDGSPLADQHWVAVWQISEYPTVLRVSANTVDAGERWDGATDADKGWLEARLRTHYMERVEVPYYEQINKTYTYEGFFDAQVAGTKVSAATGDTRAAAEDADGSDADTDSDAGAGSGAGGTAGAGGGSAAEPGNAFILTSAAQSSYRHDTDGCLLASDDYAGTQFWLHYTTVKIGVTTPVSFIYLCEGADGRGFEQPAYVVGQDNRTMLESTLSFQTDSTTSHPLKIEKVVCETDAAGVSDASADNRWKGRKLLADVLLTDFADASDKRVFWLTRKSSVETIKDANSNWYSSRDDESADDKRLYFGFGGSDNVLDGEADAELGAQLAKYRVMQPNDGASTGVVTNANKGAKNDYERMVADGEWDGFVAGQLEGRTFKDDAEKAAYITSLEDAFKSTRTTTFCYGLDLNKCSISASNVRTLMGKGTDDGVATDRYGLARLTFTFAPAE